MFILACRSEFWLQFQQFTQQDLLMARSPTWMLSCNDACTLKLFFLQAIAEIFCIWIIFDVFLCQTRITLTSSSCRALARLGTLKPRVWRRGTRGSKPLRARSWPACSCVRAAKTRQEWRTGTQCTPDADRVNTTIILVSLFSYCLHYLLSSYCGLNSSFCIYFTSMFIPYFLFASVILSIIISVSITDLKDIF